MVTGESCTGGEPIEEDEGWYYEVRCVDLGRMSWMSPSTAPATRGEPSWGRLRDMAYPLYGSQPVLAGSRLLSVSSPGMVSRSSQISTRPQHSKL